MKEQTSDYSGLEELFVMDKATNYNNWLYKLCLPYIDGDIIEIGSGIGTFTEKWRQLNKGRVTAVEIAPNCVAYLRDRFKDSINIIDKAIEQIGMPEHDNYNTAISFNVFEHIKDDKDAFDTVRQTLKQSGRFLLFVPACQVLYGKTDEAIGHYRRYNKKELHHKLSSVGFEVEKIHYVNFAGFFAWYLTAKNSNSAVSARNVMIYDKMVVPWLKQLESIIVPPFGQSLFAVAKKL